MPKPNQHRNALSTDVASGDAAGAPTEFRLFRAGRNETTKGVFLYDEIARDRVLAVQAAYSVDLMIDLEHQSLAADHASRGDAADARGWFALEDRAGELWAVNVRWTPDGLRRLSERTQRFISPTFFGELLEGEPEGGVERVVEIVNVALCAMPATHGAVPLVAASKGARRGVVKPLRKATKRIMNSETIQAALDAIAADDGAAALGVLRDLVAEAAGGDASGESEMDAAAGGEGSGSEALAEGADAPPADDEKATLAALRKVFGAATDADLISRVRALSTSVARLEEGHASIDRVERLALVEQLIELGVETPVTAWANAAKRELCKRLASEPLGEMRTRIAQLTVGRPKPRQLRAPATRSEVSVKDKVAALSAGMLAKIKQQGLTPAEFIERRDNSSAFRRSSSEGN